MLLLYFLIISLYSSRWSTNSALDLLIAIRFFSKFTDLLVINNLIFSKYNSLLLFISAGISFISRFNNTLFGMPAVRIIRRFFQMSKLLILTTISVNGSL